MLFAFAEAKELKNFRWEGVKLYLRSPWNKIDMITLACVFGAMILRLTCAPALDLILSDSEQQSCLLSGSHYARNVYAIVLLLLFLKLLAYAEIKESVGVHVIILGEVLKSDVSVFAIIVAIVSTGFGTALTLELDAWVSTDLGDPSRDFMERPIAMPFWALVGYFNHYDIPNQAGDANPTRVLVPVLLFLYLIGVVVLVNLMIAAM